MSTRRRKLTREQQIELARSQVAYWTETLASKRWASQYREAWGLALKEAQTRLAALEAA